MSNYHDPTHAEMRKFLMKDIHEDYEFDVEEAIYWYAHDRVHSHERHAGQFTNLYETLSRLSPFKPGAYSTGLSDGPALELYMMLQEEFGGA